MRLNLFFKIESLFYWLYKCAFRCSRYSSQYLNLQTSYSCSSINIFKFFRVDIMLSRVSEREMYYKKILLQIMDEPWDSYTPVSTATLSEIRAGEDKHLKIYLSDVRLHAVLRDKKVSGYDFRDTIDYLHVWNDAMIGNYVLENLPVAEDVGINTESLSGTVAQVVSGLSAQSIVGQLSSASSSAVAGLISTAVVSDYQVQRTDPGIDYLFWVKLAGVTAAVAMVAVYAARKFDLREGFKYYVDSLPYTIYGKKPPSEAVAYKARMVDTAEVENLLTESLRFER
jgi:hypothetical protein